MFLSCIPTDFLVQLDRTLHKLVHSHAIYESISTHVVATVTIINFLSCVSAALSLSRFHQVFHSSATRQTERGSCKYFAFPDTILSQFPENLWHSGAFAFAVLPLRLLSAKGKPSSYLTYRPNENIRIFFKTRVMKITPGSAVFLLQILTNMPPLTNVPHLPSVRYFPFAFVPLGFLSIAVNHDVCYFHRCCHLKSPLTFLTWVSERSFVRACPRQLVGPLITSLQASKIFFPRFQVAVFDSPPPSQDPLPPVQQDLPTQTSQVRSVSSLTT